MSRLWYIATYAKTKIGMTVLDGILTNLPSPLIVNPYGVYKSVSEVIEKKKSIDHNGWVFSYKAQEGYILKITRMIT